MHERLVIDELSDYCRATIAGPHKPARKTGGAMSTAMLGQRIPRLYGDHWMRLKGMPSLPPSKLDLARRKTTLCSTKAAPWALSFVKPPWLGYVFSPREEIKAL